MRMPSFDRALVETLHDAPRHASFPEARARRKGILNVVFVGALHASSLEIISAAARTEERDQSMRCPVRYNLLRRPSRTFLRRSQRPSRRDAR